MKPTIRRHADGLARCSWCSDDPEYVAYHDREWGVPPRLDRRWFEKVCLEGFQSGLSWLTILKKRDRFREAFADFRPQELARFGPRDVTRLLKDAGIVRHRGKIESVLNNARRALELIEQAGSLRAYFVARRVERRFTGWEPSTPESTDLSKDLRRRGWTYVGPTTMHALMQATGLVNDHATGCASRAAAAELRRQRL